jgi:uncharacterized damage-inducible protein DinB
MERSPMTAIERIREGLSRSFEGAAWHGPAVLPLLADVTAATAAAHPVAGAHSIWELVLHMAVWKRVVRRRLEGERINDLPPHEDWPPVTEVTDDRWRRAVEELRRTHRELAQTVATLDAERLDEPLVGEGTTTYSVDATLHGIIEHDLYHAGQIAILKRAQTRA